MSTRDYPDHPTSSAIRVSFVLALLGGATMAAGLLLEPQRTWTNLLLVSNFLVGLGLSGLVLVALYYVTGARWILTLRRIPEAMTTVLPLAAIGLAAVLICRPSVYSWWATNSPNPVEPPLRRFWLNRPFFLVRAGFYFVVWIAFAIALVRNSRRQDVDQTPIPTGRNTKLSAAFLVVFGVTCWLASYDWLMSLESDWVSTMFAVYNFTGLFLSGLAAVAILMIGLRRYEAFRSLVSGDLLHDLGTMLFGFSSFWMYTWFFQYLLIWYVNNPEETAYYVRRMHGHWRMVMLLSLALN
jgi:hypothetical protein